MKYERFEDLPVWQAALDLMVRVDAFVGESAFRSKGYLRDQLQRAALSVSNNIAEGFERGTTQELLTFLYTARGSAGEVRSMTHVMDRFPVFSNLKSPISNLRSLSESIARQLRAWADSLQNTEIKGQRYLNDTVRAERDQRTRTDAFWQQLEAAAERNRHATGYGTTDRPAETGPSEI